MSKNVVETEGPQMTSQYGAYALRAGLARLYACMLMHTPTHPGTHMHARASMHTHTPICNTYSSSAATMVSLRRLILRQKNSVLSCCLLTSWSLKFLEKARPQLGQCLSVLLSTNFVITKVLRKSPPPTRTFPRCVQPRLLRTDKRA